MRLERQGPQLHRPAAREISPEQAFPRVEPARRGPQVPETRSGRGARSPRAPLPFPVRFSGVDAGFSEPRVRPTRPQWPGKRRRQARVSPPPRPRPLPAPEAGVSIHPSGVQGGTAGGGALEGAAPRQALEERFSSRPRVPLFHGTAGSGGRAVGLALLSVPGTGSRGCEGLHGARPRLPGLDPKLRGARATRMSSRGQRAQTLKLRGRMTNEVSPADTSSL